MRRLIFASLVGVVGCTEPNPNAAESTGSEGGPSSGGDPSSAGTTPGTSMTSSPDTTVSGSEDPDTTVGTTVDPSETTVDPTEPTTGEPSCAHECVALPPGDWEGPVAVLHDAPDDPEPACEGAFDTLATTAFANLDAPAASCACDCEDPTGLSCSSVTLEGYPSAGCGGTASDLTVTGSCTNAVSSTLASWRAIATIDAGDCDPIETFSVPAAGFGDRYSACGQASLETTGCEAGTACISTPAAPYDGRLCIWHSGDLQCPADSGYETRTVYYGAFADDRGCESCGCEDPEGSCEGNVGLWGDDNCPGAIVAQVSVGGSCVNAASIDSVRLGADGVDAPDDAACTPSDSQAVGEAEGVDPITFCCDS